MKILFAARQACLKGSAPRMICRSRRNIEHTINIAFEAEEPGLLVPEFATAQDFNEIRGTEPKGKTKK